MAAPVFPVLPINASCFANNPYFVPLLSSGRQKASGKLRVDDGNRLCGERKGSKLVVRAGDLLGDFGARDPFPAEIESNFAEKVLGDAGTEHKILIPNVPALSLADRSCEPLPAGQAPLSQQEATALLRKVVGWRIVEGDDGLRLECFWKVKNLASGIELSNRIASVAETAGHHPEIHVEEGNRVRARIRTPSIAVGKSHPPAIMLTLQPLCQPSILIEPQQGNGQQEQTEGAVLSSEHFNLCFFLPVDYECVLVNWLYAGGLSLNDFILAAKIDQIKTSDLIPRKRVWA